jgi:hypothetical protein
MATKSAARYFAKAYDKHGREKQRVLAKFLEMATRLPGLVGLVGHHYDSDGGNLVFDDVVFPDNKLPDIR